MFGLLSPNAAKYFKQELHILIQATIEGAQLFLCMFMNKMFRFDQKLLMFAVIRKFFQGHRHFVHVFRL